MTTILLRRGELSNLPALSPGEPGFTTDTFELYIGTLSDGNKLIGNMTKSIYDTNNNGIVDNSEKLGNQYPSYYLNLNNHTGELSADLLIDGVNNFVFTSAFKTKLNGIAANATKVEGSTVNGNILINGDETIVYRLPSSLPATMIDTDSTHRFVTDTQITAWDGKENYLAPTSSSYYYRGDKTWQLLDKIAVGLGNVDNVADMDKPVSTAMASALNQRVSVYSIGVANGICPLNSSAKISAQYLPSYIDDVMEFDNLAAFPVTGEISVIYIALDSGKIYRWGGSSYTEISASPTSTDVIPEGITHLYFTTQRAANAAPVQSVATKTGNVTLYTTDLLDMPSSAPLIDGTFLTWDTATSKWKSSDNGWVFDVGATLQQDNIIKWDGVSGKFIPATIGSVIPTLYLSALNDVTITSPQSAQFLKYNGTKWINDVVTKANVGLGNVLNVDTTNPANINQSSSYRFVTDALMAGWDAKANATHYHTTSYITNFSIDVKNVIGSTIFNTGHDVVLSYDVDNMCLSADLPASGITTGVYRSVNVNSKGIVTAGSNPTTLAGYGITDATPSSHIGSGGASHAAVTYLANGFMINTDKEKIDTVATGATKVETSSTNGNIKINGSEETVYTHPSTHPATMITTDTTHRFATDTQINAWTNKAELVPTPTNGDIVITNGSGVTLDSGKKFNDIGTTVNDILSAAKVYSIVNAGFGSTKVDVYQSTAQTIVKNTWTKVSYQTKSNDPSNEFNTTSSRFTVATSGRYLCIAAIVFGQSGTGNRYVQFYKNGKPDYCFNIIKAISSTAQTSLEIVYPYDLVSTDYIEVYVQQDTNANLDLVPNYTRFSATKIA